MPVQLHMPNFSQCLLMKINFLTLRFLRCGKALQLPQSVTDLLANLAVSAVNSHTVNLTVKALFTVNIRCRILYGMQTVDAEYSTRSHRARSAVRTKRVKVPIALPSPLLLQSQPIYY